MNDKDSSSNTTYELEPLDHVFLARLEDLRKLIGVTTTSIRSMDGISALSAALKKTEQQVAKAKNFEELARAEASADFPLLYSATSVLLWGAIETAVRDILVRWLSNRPESRRIKELKNVRVRVGEYESLDGEDRFRYLADVLERELATADKPGVGRLDSLLKPLGIHPVVDDNVRRTLNELAAVRNVIVHRAGIADDRLCKLCPWLGITPGAVVKIDSKSYGEYCGATVSYSLAIINSVNEIDAVGSTGGA